MHNSDSSAFISFCTFLRHNDHDAINGKAQKQSYMYIA